MKENLRRAAVVVSAAFLLLAAVNYVTSWSDVEAGTLALSAVAGLFALVAVLLRSDSGR
ncbi:MAG: hypothetical protein ACOYX5_04090 [Actinomycetota bacterium]